MDDHLIYVKTPAGEVVMHQQTRLVQHNLRTVMGIVDGRATVAELKRQVSDGRMVAASLAELEALGLIEKLAVREERQKREAAAPAPPAPSTQESKPQIGAFVDRQPTQMKPDPDSEPPQSLADAGAPARLARLRDKFSAWRQKQKAKKEEKAFRRAYETPTEEESYTPIKIKPIRRGPRRVITWTGLLVGGLVLLAGAALLLAMLFPYERYRPEIERRLGAALRDPVTIAALRFSLLPYPNLTLERVSVGAAAYAQAKAIHVVPDPFSLFGANWVISYAALEEPVISQQGIAPSAHWFGPRPAGDRALVLRRAHVDKLTVSLGDSRVDGLSGEVAMKAEGGVAKLLLQNAERSLRLEAVPAATGYRLSVMGNFLKMPFEPGLTFEYLEAEGEISPGLLRLQKIAGKLYGGMVEGNVQIGWTQAVTLVADMIVTRANSGRLLTALSQDVAMEGEIGGRLHVESRAKDFSRLGDDLHSDGEFLAERGAIKRFDLMEAVRSDRPTRGGETRFERFSGALQSADHAWHLSKLEISSGAMQAAGNLQIAADRQLKGLMELQLKGPATRLHASVLIGGTLADPLLSPERSTRQ